MNKSLAIVLGLILVVALLLFSMTYTVSYHEVAIKTRFARLDQSSIVRDPGLKFRLPFFADNVTKIDKRLQLRESPLETVQTSDGLQVMVKAFFLWRVADQGDGDEAPRTFLARYASIDDANQVMLDTFRNAINAGVSQFRFDDLIGPTSKVEDAEQAIKREMQVFARDGIEPVSVGISQIVLPTKTTQAVLQRMQATRTAISETERIKGNAIAQGIQNSASAVADKIKAFANARAAEIREAGVAKAASSLQKMSQDQELAVFLAWIDALKESLSERTTVVIPTLFAPFHMMRMNVQADSRGIPQPDMRLDQQVAGETSKESKTPTVATGDGSTTSSLPQKEGR